MLDDHDFPKQLSILTPQTHLGQLKLNLAQRITFIPICETRAVNKGPATAHKLKT